MITNSSTCSPCPKRVATTRVRAMGKSPTPIERQKTRKAAAARTRVTSTSQGRQTNDTVPSRTPGGIDACSGSVPLAGGGACSPGTWICFMPRS